MMHTLLKGSGLNLALTDYRQRQWFKPSTNVTSWG